MRALAMACTVGLLAIGLGCAKNGGIKVADAGRGDTRQDSAGLTNNDVGAGPSDATNNDSNPGADAVEPGKDAPVTDTRAADSGRDGSAGNGRSVGSLGQCTNSCAGAAQFSACMTDSCDSDLRTCFGPSYASNSFSGACADYVTCLWKCPCDGTAKSCEQGCLPLLVSGSCLTCLTNSACMLATCGGPPACILPIGTPGPDGGTPGVDGGRTPDGGSTAGGCTRALACCSTLGASLGPICTALVTGRTDAECDAVLSQPQYAAFCP
jgi:hypothetical protein